MVKQASLFSQLIAVFNRNNFYHLVMEHKAERHSKGFSSWDQFVSMLFCQLAQAKSLREICGGLACCVGKLRHLGMTAAPKKSTLSYANAHRPWELFRDLFYQTLRTCQSAAPGHHKFRFKNKLLSLDSVTISLCLSLFPFISLMLLFCFLAPAAAQEEESETWKWISPLPTGYDLNSVWGTSDSNVYAVGDEGTILHYDGSSWSSVESPTDYDLNAIAGNSASDIYAVGERGIVLHFNGEYWSTNTLGSTLDLVALQAIPPADFYAVDAEGTIFHHDGTIWRSFYKHYIGQIVDVWGTSPEELYAVWNLYVRDEHQYRSNLKCCPFILWAGQMMMNWPSTFRHCNPQTKR
ncbi:DUF4372 domain-containing protein [Thermodesulfobacteriota bacterium]